MLISKRLGRLLKIRSERFCFEVAHGRVVTCKLKVYSDLLQLAEIPLSGFVIALAEPPNDQILNCSHRGLAMR